MHLTCAGKSEAELVSLLTAAREAGVRNILALSGEPVKGTAAETPCLSSLNLINMINSMFPGDFGVAAGVYPEGWRLPGSETGTSTEMSAEVAHAKVKVDAGARLLICQFGFSAEHYHTFVKLCRVVGITVPILPGLLAVDQPRTALNMADHCHVPLPATLRQTLATVSEEAAGQPHTALQTQLCATAAALLGANAPGLHFYLLNLQSALTHVLRSDSVAAAFKARGGLAVHRRKLPWRASAVPERETEAVRPIFWANRSKSYIQRTAAWQEYPTGRWSDVADGGGMPSLAPGALQSTAVGADFLTGHAPSPKESSPTSTTDTAAAAVSSELGGWGDAADRRALWGERLESEQAVWDVFVGYLKGTVPRIPWCEMEMHPETGALGVSLQAMNNQGLLTINSQPQVGGEVSDHPVHGWGGPGGVVYQKAYVEFFARPEVVSAVMDVAGRAAFASIRFMAIDSRGNSYGNSKPGGATAVTWGVFPGREVVQPTVGDPEAFHVWRQEAFGLWREVWGNAYDEESSSYDLLHGMVDRYYLINIVENDYVKGNIWEFIHAVLQQLGGAGLPELLGTNSQPFKIT
jgi:methylenetetrahydrofolate reductase (NADPH)